MLFRVSILALAMLSSAAYARDVATLDRTLTDKEGMSLVSDGLYAQNNGQDESYVAINRAGRDTLRTIMQQHRAKIEQGYAADGISRSEQASLNDLDRSIAELSNSGPDLNSTSEHTGNCGATQIYARAISNGGTSASAYSVASNATGPVDATNNYASTTLGFNFQSTNTSGATPASVNSSNPKVCNASAFADVTCPGQPEPSVVAFAVSYRTGSLSCFLH